MRLPSRANKSKSLINAVIVRAGIPFQREYKFLPTRGWSFDWAIYPLKIAVEYEGGQFHRNCKYCGGRKVLRNGAVCPACKDKPDRGWHQSSERFGKDSYKYNSAAIAGWLLLRFTTEHTEEYITKAIGSAIEARQGKSPEDGWWPVFEYGKGKTPRQRGTLRQGNLFVR